MLGRIGRLSIWSARLKLWQTESSADWHAKRHLDIWEFYLGYAQPQVCSWSTQ